MKRRAALAESQALPRKKQRTNTSQLAVTQAIVRNELRKKTDWKYADHSLTASNVTSTGTMYNLYTNLVRGDAGVNAFDGNILRPQAITMKYFMHTSQVRNVVRVILFQWFDSAVPVASGILQTNATGVACVSPILVTNKSYIKVLYDKAHQFAPTAVGGTQGDTIYGEGVTDPVTVYIPGKRLRPTRYNSTTNVVQEGNLYCLLISDDAVTPSPQITLYTRVTFSDD